MNFFKFSQTQCAQATIFTVFIIEFILFAFGVIHVPKDAEDAKFFYMLFGIFNSILTTKAFTTKQGE